MVNTPLEPFAPFLQPAVIVILFLIVIAKNKKIGQLNVLLAEERKKRSFPLLIPEKNSEDALVYLHNDSYCYAKDVRIDDIEINVDLGFKKKIRIAFEPVEILKPGHKTPLSFRAFDGSYDITDKNSVHLIHNYVDDSLDMRLNYTNLEEASFSLSVGYEKGKFFVKEAGPDK